MTGHTQLRKLATEALHWVPICDDPDCSCREAWENYADAANPQTVIDLLDEIERLKKDAERYRWLRAQEIDGEPGIPCVAVPNGMKSGYYLNEETADFAIDTAMLK